MNNKILPCPFCDGEVEEFIDEYGGAWVEHKVKHKDGGKDPCILTGVQLTTTSSFIDWNTRNFNNMKHNICPTCKEKGQYCDRFDAMYCVKCNTWLEPSCGSDGCLYCGGRPETPALYYNRKPKTYDTVMGPVYSLEHFRSLVVSGAIMDDDDGTVGAIFIDSVDRPDLYLRGWSFYPNYPSLSKEVTLDNIDKIFPGKTIQVEWLTK